MGMTETTNDLTCGRLQMKLNVPAVRESLCVLKTSMSPQVIKKKHLTNEVNNEILFD